MSQVQQLDGVGVLCQNVGLGNAWSPLQQSKRAGEMCPMMWMTKALLTNSTWKSPAFDHCWQSYLPSLNKGTGWTWAKVSKDKLTMIRKKSEISCRGEFWWPLITLSSLKWGGGGGREIMIATETATDVTWRGEGTMEMTGSNSHGMYIILQQAPDKWCCSCDVPGNMQEARIFGEWYLLLS